jgi:hypothetical protein
VYEIVWEYEVWPEHVAAFEALVQTAGQAYAALDRRGDALTVRERRLGAFDA